MEESKKIWGVPIFISVFIGTLWMLWCALNIPRFLIPVWAIWFITIGIFSVVGILLGLGISGRKAGIFINERKLMSISRFQIAMWTLIILSAYFAIYIGRLREGSVEDPLAIAIDWNLWIVMGLSGASFVGKSLISGKKGAMRPADTEFESMKAAKDLKENQDDIKENRIGVLYANKCIRDARFTDMFEHDEMRNTRFIDMGKLQMFFFTVVALLSYGTLLFQVIYTQDPAQINALPEVSEGLVAILAISHAGFLASSGITNTPVK